MGTGPTIDIWSSGTTVGFSNDIYLYNELLKIARQLISLLLRPYCHIFMLPPSTSDDEMEVAVLQIRDKFFRPFPLEIGKRLGKDGMQFRSLIRLPSVGRASFQKL